jgi:hypothetical protein
MKFTYNLIIISKIQNVFRIKKLIVEENFALVYIQCAKERFDLSF